MTELPEVELNLPVEEHNVAMVVFCRAAGVDERDAIDRARQAIVRALPKTLPLPHHGSNVAGRGVLIVDVMDVGMAMGNAYLWTEVTSKAFRQRGIGVEDE